MASSLKSSGGVTFFLEMPYCDKDPPVHIPNACSLCQSPLRASSEVYMYRGDTPFCSEECR
ncbi:hypothetical protein Taro_019826 [Colocasia esculenta]|uniref:FLZ-type domain-containing protein n=1 Tax=Colocasia esculenta TaxID=4460 RepID=A0A843V6P1_COLES|nr:hypothetical protein [Colocasia esculenta]